MDLTMPGRGLSAANQIRQSGSKAKILILSTHEFEGLEQTIEKSGCAGLVPKTVVHRELVRGVRAVLGGVRFFKASL